MTEAPGKAAQSVSLVPYGTLWFTYFTGIGLFGPFSALWFSGLGFSALSIGVLASVQAWTRVASPYVWGWLGDHTGRRADLIRASAFLSLLAALALAWGPGHYSAVALLVGLLFLFNGGVVPLAEAALARHISSPDGLDAARYGRVRMWGSLGFIAAVANFGWILSIAGIASFPWWLAGLYGLLWVASMRLPAGAEPTGHTAQVHSVWTVLRRPEVAWCFASIFLTVLSHSFMYTFFSLYLVELGWTKGTIGLIWALGVVVEVIFFWSQGRWFGRLSPHRWLMAAGAVAAVRMAVTAGWGGYALPLLLAQLTHCVTFAAHHGACIALVHRYFPGALRGRGQALYSVIGYGLSGVAGGLLGGVVTESLGFAAVFWVASAVAVLGAWAAWRSHRLAADQGA